MIDATGERACATSPDDSTLVAYIEKAAAAYLGSYDDLGFGNATYALHWLLGDNGRPHVYAAETFALDGIVLADTDHAGLRRHLTVEDLRTLNPGVSWVSNEKPRLAES